MRFDRLLRNDDGIYVESNKPKMLPQQKNAQATPMRSNTKCL